MIEELANQPAEFAYKLRRWGEALNKAGKALTDISDTIMNSVFVRIDEIFAAASEIETLGKGFEGLGSQFEEFANLSGNRKGQYEKDTEQVQTRSDRINGPLAPVLSTSDKTSERSHADAFVLPLCAFGPQAKLSPHRIFYPHTFAP